MAVRIRPLEHSDFPAWLPLWDGNNNGARDEAVTTETWSRICDPDFPIFGLCAFNGDEMVGIVHWVLHATTGYIEPICYMQDVYVSARHRRQGVGRKLVEAVTKIAKREKWKRLYWLAQDGNKEAQALYKNLGVKLDFALHVMPLN